MKKIKPELIEIANKTSEYEMTQITEKFNFLCKFFNKIYIMSLIGINTYPLALRRVISNSWSAREAFLINFYHNELIMNKSDIYE